MLWVFAFLAGIIQTGAITNDVLRLTPQIGGQALSWATLKASFETFSYRQSFFHAFFGSTDQQTITAIVAATVCAVLLAIIILTAQHLVLLHIHRTAKKKKQPGFWATLKSIRGAHLSRLFAVNALSRLSLAILLLLGTLAIRSLLLNTPNFVHLYVSLGIFLIIIPAAFAINATTMLTLLHVVRENDALPYAFQRATTFLHKHWLAVLEFSIVLFAINFLFSLFLLGGAYLLALVFLTLSAVSASAIIAVLLTLLASSFIILLFFVLFDGFMVSFNYAAWSEFLERFEKSPVHPRSEHLAHHLRKRLT
ncbi:TPA: hypothetical protein DEP96_04080 [Candidatus Uhrbacteria bacterium]|nr:hypothetical protein [Candidatus Uhrbacteria bacterium]